MSKNYPELKFFDNSKNFRLYQLQLIQNIYLDI